MKLTAIATLTLLAASLQAQTYRTTMHPMLQPYGGWALCSGDTSAPFCAGQQVYSNEWAILVQPTQLTTEAFSYKLEIEDGRVFTGVFPALTLPQIKIGPLKSFKVRMLTVTELVPGNSVSIGANAP